MTSKEYLMQVQRLNILIDQRIKEKDALRNFDLISGIDYSQDKVQTSHSSDAIFVKVIEKIIEIESEVNRLIDEYVSLKNKIIGEIQMLQNPQYIQILYKKYVEFKQLKVIAVEMNYSYNYIKRIHGCALLDFGKQFIKDRTQ